VWSLESPFGELGGGHGGASLGGRGGRAGSRGHHGCQLGSRCSGPFPGCAETLPTVVVGAVGFRCHLLLLSLLAARPQLVLAVCPTVGKLQGARRGGVVAADACRGHAAMD
jgi:hypothetical protein